MVSGILLVGLGSGILLTMAIICWCWFIRYLPVKNAYRYTFAFIKDKCCIVKLQLLQGSFTNEENRNRNIIDDNYASFATNLATVVEIYDINESENKYNEAMLNLSLKGSRPSAEVIVENKPGGDKTKNIIESITYKYKVGKMAKMLHKFKNINSVLRGPLFYFKTPLAARSDICNFGKFKVYKYINGNILCFDPKNGDRNFMLKYDDDNKLKNVVNY